MKAYGEVDVQIHKGIEDAVKLRYPSPARNVTRLMYYLAHYLVTMLTELYSF
jgi:hypothetical protein